MLEEDRKNSTLGLRGQPQSLRPALPSLGVLQRKNQGRAARLRVLVPTTRSESEQAHPPCLPTR